VQAFHSHAMDLEEETKHERNEMIGLKLGIELDK
jgi:hypothetical protein